MFSFMISVLGTTLFWILYFFVSLVVGSTFIKRMFPKVWKTIEDNKRCYSSIYPSLKVDIGAIILIVLLCYLLWPFLVVGVVFAVIIKSCGLFFAKVIWPCVRKSILVSSSIIPDIEIKKNNDEHYGG